jgi:hypothetical protein
MSDRPPYDRDSRADPEIIPPGEPVHLRPRRETRIWISRGGQGGEIRFRKPGLLGIIAGALVAGLVCAVALAILASVVLIWIPLVGLIVAALILTGIMRGWKRPG